MKVGRAARWELGNLFCFPLTMTSLDQEEEKKEEEERNECQLVGEQPTDQQPTSLVCLPVRSTWLPSNLECTFGLSNDSSCCSGSGATNEAS